MTERTLPHTHRAREIWQRSFLKTISYRILIIILDFGFIYLFTHRLKFAFGFVFVSNIYTSIAYFLHERYWNGLKWGKFIYKKEIVNPKLISTRIRLPNYQEALEQ